jgi:hypothetical protein
MGERWLLGLTLENSPKANGGVFDPNEDSGQKPSIHLRLNGR